MHVRNEVINVGEIPERPSNVAVVESCTLFNALTTQEQENLIRSTFMAYAERGETIWLSGSPSSFCAIVASGFVKMTRTTPSGQEVAMELLGPGQAFGLLAAIEGRPFPLSAIAVTHCWYLKIPTKALLDVYNSSSALKDQIVRNLGPRLRRAHSMMSRLSTGSAAERIAAVLFILADSYGQQVGKKIRLVVPLTRQEIGEMAGTTVETTIRVMSRWQREGILETDHHVVTILDSSQLERILQE
jgi:CRP/FNR family transcriptional regulator